MDEKGREARAGYGQWTFAAADRRTAVSPLATVDAGAQALLDEVRAFVAAHPQIQVDPSGTAIPADCREELFDLLTAARVALVRQAAVDGGFAGAARARLAADRTALERDFGLAMEVPSELQAFLDEGAEGASKLSLDTMLCWLQGALADDELAAEVASDASSQVKRLSQAAFELALYAEVLLALRPKRVFGVRTLDQKTVELYPIGRFEVGMQDYFAVLRLPELVVEGERGAFATKFELASEVDFYGSKPLRRRDYSMGGDSRGMVGRRYVLLYRLPSPDAAGIIANRDTGLVVAPTAMVGAVFADDVRETLYLRGTVQRCLALGSRRGLYLADPDGVADEARATAEPYGTSVVLGSGALGAADLPQFIDSLIA